MAQEAESTQLQLEVPDHDATIKATRDELLHAGVEANGRYRILVAAEGAFEGRKNLQITTPI